MSNFLDDTRDSDDQDSDDGEYDDGDSDDGEYDDGEYDYDEEHESEGGNICKVLDDEVVETDIKYNISYTLFFVIH